MEKIAELVRRLRGVESRSKQELLTEAADALEKLCQRVEDLEWRKRADEVPVKTGHYLCWYHYESYPARKYCQVLSYFAADKEPHFQYEQKLDLVVDYWKPVEPKPDEQRIDKTLKQCRPWLRKRFLGTE